MGLMFFRRQHLNNPTFTERLETLRSAGFTLAPMAGGVVRAGRGRCAVDLKEENGTVAIVGRAGLAQGSEIGVLVDGGFQKFFETPSGGKKPALADDLNALHEFEEDLKQGLGQESYYNQSLGTVSTFYRYDRVKDRDRGVPKRVWE
jgi:L-aminopeptidase/D-esterase-like protein